MTQRSFKPILLDLLHQAQISQNAFFQELTPAELATIGTAKEQCSRKSSDDERSAYAPSWRSANILASQRSLTAQSFDKITLLLTLLPLFCNYVRCQRDLTLVSDQKGMSSPFQMSFNTRFSTRCERGYGLISASEVQSDREQR